MADLQNGGPPEWRTQIVFWGTHYRMAQKRICYVRYHKKDDGLVIFGDCWSPYWQF